MINVSGKENSYIYASIPASEVVEERLPFPSAERGPMPPGARRASASETLYCRAVTVTMISLSPGTKPNTSTRAFQRQRQQKSVFLSCAPRGDRCRRGLRRASASQTPRRRAATVKMQSLSPGTKIVTSTRAFQRPMRRKSVFLPRAPRGDRCHRGARRASASETPRCRATMVTMISLSPGTTTISSTRAFRRPRW